MEQDYKGVGIFRDQHSTELGIYVIRGGWSSWRNEDVDAVIVGNIKSVAPDCSNAWSNLCTEYGSPQWAEMLL
ncbi:hypothetical protein SRHO_G00183780 [Serrasalmus rhombeus]